MKKKPLTIKLLCAEAKVFSNLESKDAESSLYGVTDGKAVGTYLEHKFKKYLNERYDFVQGNSASGIDFPELGVDMKATSRKQPQSSCPFKSARQKIYGLGYGLIVFVYEKMDNSKIRKATLRITDTVFVESARTADFQMTRGLCNIIDNDGSKEDLIAFMMDRNLPVDDLEINRLAEEILLNRPEQGYLTISNALQWRLQYGRIIETAGQKIGVHSIYKDTSWHE